MEKTPFYPPLDAFIQELMAEVDLIPEARMETLAQFGSYIAKKQVADRPVLLHFICTHNSRRSQIGQIWAATAAHYFGLDNLFTFSGGTETTAFNPRAVAAMERAGFQINEPGGINPHYRVSFSPHAPGVVCFSKTYDDPINPRKGFAAIMTCSEADENCPFIPGAEMRLALTYEDPKEADDSPAESARYDDRVRQIGREIFYAMKLAASSNA